MSGRYDWDCALRLVDVPFNTLIMAAALKADTVNYRLLSEAFPELVAEAQARYHAPGGRLPSDR